MNVIIIVVRHRLPLYILCTDRDHLPSVRRWLHIIFLGFFFVRSWRLLRACIEMENSIRFFSRNIKLVVVYGIVLQQQLLLLLYYIHFLCIFDVILELLSVIYYSLCVYHTVTHHKRSIQN